ncbi:CCCH zinc finger domain-containing protein [Dioscorea alata]|uniref:CCCH zinc finger domain-containing protein n=2 Tax=Dioscorea alata TaxID=55571 RepID=A0ACB7VSJ6_DIOAL|nr:CCCH zinc finger domain-containing protein [Dioscorea alata]
MEPLSKRPRSEFDGPGFRHLAADGRDVGQQSFSPAGKPKPCMKFFSTSGCPFGESCHFLHYVPGGLSSLGVAPVASLSAASSAANQRKPAGPGGDPSVTVNGFKTKLCNKFNTAEGCRFGDKCHFAHGESDLRPANNLSRGNRRPMSNGPSPAFSNRPNPAGSPTLSVSEPNFPSQGYVQLNEYGAPDNNDASAVYPAGPVSENVSVC